MTAEDIAATHHKTVIPLIADTDRFWNGVFLPFMYIHIHILSAEGYGQGNSLEA